MGSDADNVQPGRRKLLPGEQCSWSKHNCRGEHERIGPDGSDQGYWGPDNAEFRCAYVEPTPSTVPAPAPVCEETCGRDAWGPFASYERDGAEYCSPACRDAGRPLNPPSTTPAPVCAGCLGRAGGCTNCRPPALGARETGEGAARGPDLYDWDQEDCSDATEEQLQDGLDDGEEGALREYARRLFEQKENLEGALRDAREALELIQHDWNPAARRRTSCDPFTVADRGLRKIKERRL